jgi:membrane-associated phospholipid phosphatase
VADGRVGRLTAFPFAARPAPRWPLVIWGAILLGLMVGLRYWVDHVGPLPGDRWAAGRLQVHPIEPVVLVQIQTFFASLASATIAIATVVTALILVLRRCGRLAGVGLLLSCLGVAWNALLKGLWGPTDLFRHTLLSSPYFHGPVDANFPSGHVTYAVVVFGCLAVLAWRHGQREGSVLAVLLVLGMGPARVLAGDHLVSDAVGGYLLGAGWLLVIFGLEPVWAAAVTRRRIRADSVDDARLEVEPATRAPVEAQARGQDVTGQVKKSS